MFLFRYAGGTLSCMHSDAHRARARTRKSEESDVARHICTHTRCRHTCASSPDKRGLSDKHKAAEEPGALRTPAGHEPTAGLRSLDLFHRSLCPSSTQGSNALKLRASSAKAIPSGQVGGSAGKRQAGRRLVRRWPFTLGSHPFVCKSDRRRVWVACFYGQSMSWRSFRRDQAILGARPVAPALQSTGYRGHCGVHVHPRHRA